MKVQIKRVRDSSPAALPSYGTPGSAGLDLAADLDEPVRLEPGQTTSDSNGPCDPSERPRHCRHDFAKVWPWP